MSVDGGQTWALASVPAGTGVLQSTACLTASDCLAAGTTGTTVSDVVPAQGALLHSTDGGHTWTPSTGALPVDDVYGLACPSDDQCAMVGTTWMGDPAVGAGGVAQSTDAGLTFRSSPTSYVPITADRGDLPVGLALSRRRGRHRGQAHAPPPQRRLPAQEPAGPTPWRPGILASRLLRRRSLVIELKPP